MLTTHTEERTHYSCLERTALLPVKQRIDHKIMPLAYKCYEGTVPEYLQELIPRYVHTRPLLSSSKPSLLIPSAAEKHTKKQFGFRAFLQLCFQALECSTTTNQGSRHLGGASQTSENAPVLLMICPMCLFLRLVSDFLSISPTTPPFSALSIQVNGNAL